MEVKLSVKLTAKDMFNFMIKHTYSTISGYVGILISICALLGFITTFNNENVTIQYKLVLIVTALLFLVIQPVNLYTRSKKQVEQNENVNKPMEYTFDDSKIFIRQDEETAEYRWDQVLKISSTNRSLFLYTSKYRAFILPKSEFAEGDIENFRTLVRKNAVNAKSINFGRI